MIANDMYETERLILRRFGDEDRDAIYRLRSNPEFMQYLTRVESREESGFWIEYFSRFWKYNAGFWAVVLKETGETVGWCGTWSLLEFEIGKMEIGAAIAKKYSGRNLATEALQVALEYTFNVRGAENVYALRTPNNLASHRITEKLGMRLEGQRFFPSYKKEMVYHAITREEFERKVIEHN